MKKYLIIVVAIASFGLLSCSSDYLETAPTKDITDKDIFSSVESTQMLLEGMHRLTYKSGGDHDRFGITSVNIIVDSMGEDFFPNETGYNWFVTFYQYINSRIADRGTLEWVWSFYYELIDNANIILENIDNVPTFDNNAKLQQRNNIKAQAYTYRAYAYYQLVQLWAVRYDFVGKNNTQLGVPIISKHGSGGMPRSTVEQVYAQINSDLDAALAIFGSNTHKRLNRSHINGDVANAIAARVALTTGEWSKASAYAKAARKNYQLEKKYTYGFNKISTEWIWGALVIDEQQTSYASFFSHIDPFFGGYASLGNQKLLSTSVYNFMSNDDVRKACFDDAEGSETGKPHTGFKFSGWGEWTNDYLYLKAGEMYLIEAEAEARLGNNVKSQDVLFELIHDRDPSYVKSALTGDELIQHILMHRRADLWGEGLRFFDIKRLNIDLDRRGIGHNETLWDKAGYIPAGDKRFQFLIPEQEMKSNPKMVQNEL